MHWLCDQYSLCTSCNYSTLILLLEVDREGVIPGDTDSAQDMGDETKEVTESDEQEVYDLKHLTQNIMYLLRSTIKLWWCLRLRACL